MTERPVIRIIGEKPIPEGLARVLGELVPDYEEERYLGPDYQKYARDRIDSLYRAFLYLLEAYPPKCRGTILGDFLPTYAKDCLRACTLSHTKDLNPPPSFEQLQEELRVFSAQLITIIKRGWGKELTSKDPLKEAVDLLNLAEQHEMLGEKRPHMRALVPIAAEGGKTFYTLIQDTPQDSDYPELIAEMTAIKNQGYPKTPFELRPFDKKLNAQQRNFVAQSGLPLWYWVLSEPLQYFLEHTLKHNPDIRAAITSPSSRFRHWPMLSNFWTNEIIMFHSTGEIKYRGRKNLRCANPASRDTLPYPEEVQRTHVERNLEQLLGHMPDELKVRAQEWKAWDEGYKRWEDSDRETSQPATPKKRRPLAAMQTLISPIEAISRWMPDPRLDALLRGASGRSQTPLFLLNHALNLGRVKEYTEKNDPRSLAFKETAKTYEPTFPELAGLLSDYQYTLDQAPANPVTALMGEVADAFIQAKNRRELWLAVLEHAMIDTVQEEGFLAGCCVSAKDRKAVILISAIAARHYFTLYHCWPRFNDTGLERARYVSLVAQLYLTRLYQTLAGLNAKGAEGIKNAKDYFPLDIRSEIDHLGGKGYLERDNALASTNEVKDIHNGRLETYAAAQHSLQVQLIAENIVAALTDEECKKLISACWLLVGEKEFFQGAWTPMKLLKWSIGCTNDPVGLVEIENIIKNKDSRQQGARITLKRIICVIYERPEYSLGRDQNTVDLYNIFHDLSFYPNCSVHDALTLLNAMFERAKKARGTASVECTTITVPSAGRSTFSSS